MKETVHVVKGICRHFSGDCETFIVAVRRDRDEAMKVGYEWVKSMNEEFRYNGQNIHASYSLVDRELK